MKRLEKENLSLRSKIENATKARETLQREENTTLDAIRVGQADLAQREELCRQLQVQRADLQRELKRLTDLASVAQDTNTSVSATAS